MSDYINALIARGGTPLYSAAGNLQDLNTLKQQEANIAGTKTQNALQEFALAQAPELQRRSTRDDEIKTLARSAQEFVALGEAQDWEGATRVIDAIPDNLMGGKAAQLKAQWKASRATPNPNDDLQALNQAKAFLQSVTEAEKGKDPANYQFAASRPAIGITQSGNKINGSVEVIRDPNSGVPTPKFIPDVGEIDPNDPIISTENVGRTGITGEEQNQATRERMIELELLRTRELATRKKEDAATTRLTNFADSGLSSAEAYTTTKRSLDLLKGIETGGFEGVALRARQLFGIQAADEAELTTGMLRGVLAQLRPIFGAAFTAAEGDSLKAIEANIGKSTEGNRALLSQLLKIQERSAKRGAAAARKIGDDFTADEIEAQLQFDLSEGTPQEQNKPQAAGTPTQSDVVTVTTQEQYDALPSGAFYTEDGKTYRKP